MEKESHIHENGSVKNLILAIFINVFIVIFEVIFGLISGSLSLISDALHNITDVCSMVLSFFGEKISTKPNDNRKTYGYKKTEAIIAFINGGVLLAVVGFIFFEAIKRILNPAEVSGMQMIFVAFIALIGNGAATWLLENDSHKNLNLKSAWLHSFQDAIFSLAVIIGAVAIYFTGFEWIDPALSIVISVFLLKEIWDVFIEAIDMLLDSVPKDIKIQDIRKNLLGIEGVEKVEDLHVWQNGSKNVFLSSHILVKSDADRIKSLIKLQKMLKEKYNICHSTLQIVSKRDVEDENFECKHCN
ncbi:MAG: cation diffusion facilitator family transporter [Patescibacteria group bacterium]